jgi:peptidoglycan hydrolase CwlO-like protein
MFAFYRNSFSIAACIFFTVATADAAPPADLDVESARAAYQREKAEADAAYSDFQTKKNIYDSAQNDLNSATQTVRNREQDLRNAEAAVNTLDVRIGRAEKQRNDYIAETDRIAIQIQSVDNQLGTEQAALQRLQRDRDQTERKLNRVNQRIRELERNPSDDEWTCIWADRGKEEHRGGHRASHSDKAEADRLAKEECESLHGNCVSRGCTQPDNSELRQAKQEKDQLERELSDLDNQIRTCENRIRSLDQNRDSYVQQDLRCRNEIRSLDTEIASLERERDRAERSIRTYESNLQVAQSELANARAYVNQVTPAYQSARTRSDREAAEAKTALAHYERIEANYQAARNKVLNAAHADAVVEAEREAEERARADATTVAAKDGTAKAEAKAAQDISGRDLFAGYWEGRGDAALLVTFATQYQDGQLDGKVRADRKAQSEDFAKGFNQAFGTLLANPPAQTVELDASVDTQEETNASGTFLTTSQMPITEVRPPVFVGPSKVAFLPPVGERPTVRAPVSNRTYYDPNCDNVVLPEFGPECKRQYDTSFAKAFGDKYAGTYQTRYVAEFNSTATAAYNAALGKTDAAALEQGRSTGVRERGVLDGFATRLAAAQREQFQMGEAHLDAYLEKGALIVVRSASLTDSSADGLLSPGEKAGVSFVVDNYGKQSTQKGAISFQKVQTEGLTGGKSVEWLPVPPGTRLTLKNAYSADVVSQIAGTKLMARGEVARAGGGGSFATVQAQDKVGFALELQRIVLDRKPKLNETMDAKFSFTNRTKSDLVETPVVLRVSPVFMEVEKLATPHTVPALAPGQTAEVTAKVKALTHVGENTDVQFYSDVQGASTVTQHFPQRVTVDRAAALLLFDRSLQEIPNSTVNVVAGTNFTIGVQVKYLRKTNSLGEIAWSVGKPSDASIRATGTSGVNYGIFSPSRKADVSWITFQVPASLKGKSGWVTVNLREGNVWQHTLAVYLNIQ